MLNVSSLLSSESWYTGILAVDFGSEALVMCYFVEAMVWGRDKGDDGLVLHIQYNTMISTFDTKIVCF